MQTLQQLEEKYLELHEIVQQEQREKEKILLSDEAVAISEQIRSLQEQQKELLEGLPNHEIEFDIIKSELIDYLQNEGKYEGFGKLKCKTKKTNKVNVARLLDVLGGDIDLFCSIANVTQKAVKDICKDHTYKAMKKDLEECIESKGEEIIDVYIYEPAGDEALLENLPF